MMNATIRLEGSRLRGYDVIVWLPQEFWEAFANGEIPEICGETLRKCTRCWGESDTLMRVAGTHFRSLSEARTYYQEVVRQINAAREIFVSEGIIETQNIPLE